MVFKGTINIKTGETTWTVPPPKIKIDELPEELRSEAVSLYLETKGADFIKKDRKKALSYHSPCKVDDNKS